MSSSHLSRRKLLRGAGYTLALPVLESLVSRSARAATKPPVRLMFYFQPDGMLEGNRTGYGEHWFPEATGTDFQLRELSAPLEPVRHDVIMFKGMNLSFQGTASQFTHPNGMKHALACGERTSFDQVMGEKISRDTRFKTLEIGVGTTFRANGNGMIHFKDGAQLPAQSNPNVLFQKLFGAGPTGMGSMADMDALARLQARRKSVLDGVVEELNALQGKVARDDRHKVEAHVASIRDVERSLMDVNRAMAQDPAACTQPQVDFSPLKDQTVWSGGGESSVPNLDKIAKVQHQLTMLAMRCDLTRVATVYYQKSASYQTYPFLPLKDKGMRQHEMAHHCWRSREKVEDFKIIKKWHASQFADLVQGLKAIREADGSTMLDNTLLLWISDMSNGAHGTTNMPYVLAGRGGGAVKSGRVLAFPGARNSRIMLTLARAAGAPLAKFGPDTEPLDLG